MAEFKRARSAEQKCQRMGEIKGAARRQFDARPYHQITLTTIAGELGWSRANLYKYVSTKEEIILLVMADLRDAYTADLVDALGTPCALDASTAARVWAQVAGRHRTYFRYGDLLYTVIETNVTVDKLEQFKRGYYAQLPEVRERLSRGLGVREELVEQLVNTVYHHAVGLAGSCLNNPLVAQAVARLGIEPAHVDFEAQIEEFVLMCLTWYRAK